MAKNLSQFSPSERKRRQKIIHQLTDPEFVLAPYLAKQMATENPIRDGFVPIGSDFRDFTIAHDRGRYHAFYIDVLMYVTANTASG